MKILFVTGYDEQTKSNLKIANFIKDTDEHFISEEFAVRESFYSKFPLLSDTHLMIMSHGNDDYIRDNNRDKIISCEDVDRFNNNKIYSWACNTGKLLGEEISSNNNIWWGYNCAITAPIDDEKYHHLYVRAFMEIKSKYVVGVSNTTILQILDEIKNMCEDIMREVDAISEAEQDNITDILQVYSCFYNMWANLVVWLNRSTSIMHPNAPPPLLEI